MKTLLISFSYLLLINNIFSQEYCFNWAKNIGNIGDNYSYEIVTDKDLNTYITGTFRATLDFGGVLLESNGTADIFIAKYDKRGPTRMGKPGRRRNKLVRGRKVYMCGRFGKLLFERKL